jgi:hypothetical protein
MFDVQPARVLEPLNCELFELVFGDHLESNVNPQGLVPLMCFENAIALGI